MFRKIRVILTGSAQGCILGGGVGLIYNHHVDSGLLLLIAGAWLIYEYAIRNSWNPDDFE